MSIDLPPAPAEFRIRIGARWFRAAWCTDEAGAVFVGAKLAGDDWLPVARAVIEEVRERAAAVPSTTAVARPVAEPVLEAAPASDHAFMTYPEFVGRVTAMVKTLKFMGDSEWRFLSAGDRINWPQYIYETEDLRAQDENHDNRDSSLVPPRFKPTPADLTRLEEVYGWFQTLDPLDAKTLRYLIKARRLPLSPPQKLVWHIALGASPYSLSKYHDDYKGQDHETIRRRHLRALERLWLTANNSLAGRFAAKRVNAARRAPDRSPSERPAQARGAA